MALALKAKEKGFTSEWVKHERRVVNEFFPNEPILNEVQNETVAQMTERISKIRFFPNEPIWENEKLIRGHFWGFALVN